MVAHPVPPATAAASFRETLRGPCGGSPRRCSHTPVIPFLRAPSSLLQPRSSNCLRSVPSLRTKNLFHFFCEIRCVRILQLQPGCARSTWRVRKYLCAPVPFAGLAHVHAACRQSVDRDLLGPLLAGGRRRQARESCPREPCPRRPPPRPAGTAGGRSIVPAGLSTSGGSADPHEMDSYHVATSQVKAGATVARRREDRRFRVGSSARAGCHIPQAGHGMVVASGGQSQAGA